MSFCNLLFWTYQANSWHILFVLKKLLTVDQAFTDLKGGEGSVVLSPKTGKVSLTSIYLAYYQQESYTPYIQPIYIFEGQDFMAYVSAIDKQYIAPNQ